MDPLVSIVVPSFQQARFLRAAIDSVLAQDYRPLQVIVMDGGSTDDSRAILESYGSLIRFRSEPDGGQAAAINAGFRQSEGEIVAWLNSDDFYLPGAVRRAVDALRREPDAALAYGDGELVDEDGNAVRSFVETDDFDLWRLANVCDYILQPAVFFRRAPLLEIGLLDEDLHWGLDWDLWLRLGERWPFVRIEERLAASRVHDATKTATGSWQRLREIHRILARHGVRRTAPATVLHTIAAGLRKVVPSSAPIDSGSVQDSMPKPTRGLARPVLRRAERFLRRWMQNSQGIWRDGLVGRVGHLWLPSDGVARRLVVCGRNLDLPGQVVGVSCAGTAVRSQRLEARQPFELAVDVPRGQVPIKLRLSCRRARRVAPLDPVLGPRRAGFRYQVTEESA